MQIQKNKRIWLKRIVVYCGMAFCIAATVILTAPSFISRNYLQQNVTQILAERFKTVSQMGPASFHWPDRIDIPYLIIQKQEQGKEYPIRFENIQSTFKLIPLVFKKVVIKKIWVRQINYENRLLVDDLVADILSLNNGVITAHARLKINEGPATIKGVIDLHQKRPAFDLSFEAKDVHITQDIPVLGLLPIFTVKDGEISGLMSLVGDIRGEGDSREILNKNLVANAQIDVRDGYIRGNKLLSSILKIVGESDLYSFDSMEAVIQIRDGKVYTQRMDVQGHTMNLSASGVVEFEGSVSYDAKVKFNKEYLTKDAAKIAGLVLKQDTLPIEIRGTTKDPTIAVKFDKDNLEHVVKGLVSDFLHTSKEKHKKWVKNN